MAGVWQYYLINSETGEHGRGGDASQVAGPLFKDVCFELTSGGESLTEVVFAPDMIRETNVIDFFLNGQKLSKTSFTRNVAANKIILNEPIVPTSKVEIEIRIWS